MYFFMDESGDWNFNPKGSEFLVFACLTIENPLELSTIMEQLKYKLIGEGLDVSFFHASTDIQIVRNRVYEELKRENLSIAVDVVYFRKNLVNPSLYLDSRKPRLYLKIYDVLLNYIFKRHNPTDLTIFTDQIPHKKWRGAVEQGLKASIRNNLDRGVTFRILHQSSKTNFCLQAVDYFAWAVYRKCGDWGGVEERPYKEIEGKTSSLFDIFRKSDGTTYYAR